MNTHFSPCKGTEEPNSAALKAMQGDAENSPSIPPSLLTALLGFDGGMLFLLAASLAACSVVSNI